MGRCKIIQVVLALMLLAGSMSACGKQDYIVEYGVDGYIWPARKIQAIDGIDDIRLTGEYLYYLQNTGSGRVVGRIHVPDMLSEGSDVLDFSRREILASVSNMSLELPEDIEEEVDLVELMGSAVSGGRINPEKEYAFFSLAEYDADEEGNLYYSLNARKGPYLEMDAAGSVLCMRTTDGREAYRLQMPDIAGLAAGGNGRAFVLTEDGILILDQNGSQIGRIGTEEYPGGENEEAEDLFRDAEGRIYCITSVRQDSRIIRKAYEIKEGEGFRLKDAGDFLGEGNMQYSPSSDGNIFLFESSNNGNVYEYDRKSGTRNKVLNLWDSGLSGFGLRTVARLSPDVLLVCYSYDLAGVFQLTRTSVETLPERELLVIASPNASEQLRQAVIQFNADSTEYRIVIDDYGATIETKGWESPYLDASLVSSNPPDIVDLGLLNIAKYGEKGVLEDLAPYIERSDDLDLGDIPENVLEGLTFNNRLVCLPTALQVQCFAARMQQTVGLEDWSMEDVYRLSEMYPESAGELVSDGFGGRMEKSWLLEEFCARYYLDRFVDWEKGSCSFTDEEFYRLLKWAEKYGAEPEKEQLEAGPIYNEYEHVPDNVMLLFRTFLNFETLAYLELQFGGEVRLMGYPTADGKGCFPAKVGGGLGIAANSSHKEAAWEFLKLYRQKDVSAAHLPVSKAKIAKSYEYLTTKEFLGNGLNGEPKWKDKAYIGLDGELTALYSIPKEQADAVMAAVENADFSPLTVEEEAVIRIVAEEAESYFSGDKNPEEAAKVIQNRVQLLLNER